MQRDTSGAYWDSHELMTRNGGFNVAIGGRGTGKTYDFKYKRIRHYIKTCDGFRKQGRQFIDGTRPSWRTARPSSPT